MSLSTKVCEYIESLTITQGEHAGQAFNLLPWERKFIKGAFKGSVETAALSIGRGNGKTCFCGAIGAAALSGPLAQPRAEIVLIASSFPQAKIAFDHIKAFVAPAITPRWRISDNAQRAVITTPEAVTLKAMASDPRRAHGLAPSLILMDEPSQWPESSADRMLAALTTSTGKIPDARIIALGTLPEDEGHWFYRWAMKGEADYSQVHTAKPESKPFQRRSWALANPSMAYNTALADTIGKHAVRAKKSDSEMQSFRALRLNQGTTDTQKPVLLTPDEWRACEVPHIANLPPAKGPLVFGVDLGSGAAMSAVTAYYPKTGRLMTIAAFPAIPTLEERGAKDGVGDRYVKMAEKGELITAGNRTVDVSELMAYAFGTFGIPTIMVADRWREGELRDSVDVAGVPVVPIVTRGMGFRDGAEDVRAFRRAILDQHVKTPESLLMRSAVSGAVTVSDAAGNRKLAKAKDSPHRREHHRDDAIASAIVAVGEGSRIPIEEPVKRGYLGLV